MVIKCSLVFFLVFSFCYFFGTGKKKKKKEVFCLFLLISFNNYCICGECA